MLLLIFIRITCQYAYRFVYDYYRTSGLSRHMIKLRTDGVNSASYADLFPPCEPGSLLEGTAPRKLQAVWKAGQALLEAHPGSLKI